MNLHGLLVFLQDLPLAAAVRGDNPGTEWLFPIVETCHVLSLTIVFGSIVMVDLRLLGWTARGSSIAGLTRETLPWVWTAWGFAALTGSMLFISKAVTYAGNFDFQMKFLCMALAAVNMLVFHFGAYRKVADWDTGRAPGPARLAGGLSMTFWLAVIFFGRWVGFTT
jgi:hypothetical protein